MIFPATLPLVLGCFLLLLVALVFVGEWRILGYAYRKIGVPARYMFVVLLLSLVGSHGRGAGARPRAVCGPNESTPGLGLTGSRA